MRNSWHAYAGRAQLPAVRCPRHTDADAPENTEKHTAFCFDYTLGYPDLPTRVTSATKSLQRVQHVTTSAWLVAAKGVLGLGGTAVRAVYNKVASSVREVRSAQRWVSDRVCIAGPR